MRTRRARAEVLGEVTLPSGTVVLVDAGLLGLWDPEDQWIVDHPATDFRIEGPDAAEAGRRFDRQWHPRYLYDTPNHGVDELLETFGDFVTAEGLDAQLTLIPEGIRNHDRVGLALEQGGGTGVVEFYGISTIVVGGLPTGRPLRVEGVRMDDKKLADLWRWVTLEVAEGEVVRTEEIASVFVDEARLMFADADALRAWKQEEALDGKADFVFWGEDAAAAAREHDTPAVDEGSFGWIDLPIDEAVTRGLAVEDTREREELHFATDFRPHSHHYIVLEEMRASRTGSGTIEVGGARLCAFFTSWGDGAFPVLRELDAAGNLIRLRIDLGNDTSIERLRAIGG